jgi:SAM-dependent methyltransferase
MISERQSFRPSKASLKMVEDCARTLSPQSQALAQWHESYVSNHKLRIALDLDIAKAHLAQDAAVLEMGSIPLLFTAALHGSGYTVTGCDIAPERYAAAIAGAGINVLKCDIETQRLPFADGCFDGVVFNELFEHLRINPIFTLSEVLRVTKPGGTLMLSSPNLRSLAGIGNFLIRNRAYSCSGDIYAEYNKLERLGHMGHVREYTTTEVIEFLAAIGFAVTKIIYRGQFHTRLRNLAIRAFPALSPFVSYIAVKPAART